MSAHLVCSFLPLGGRRAPVQGWHNRAGDRKGHCRRRHAGSCEHHKGQNGNGGYHLITNVRTLKTKEFTKCVRYNDNTIDYSEPHLIFKCKELLYFVLLCAVPKNNP